MNERQEGNGRSKLDPDLAVRFEVLKRNHLNEELFIQPRIEELALGMIRDLDLLETSMSAAELDRPGPGEDILVDAYENDQFVTNQIVPLVRELIERTTQTVYLTDNEIVGYSIILPEDDSSDDDEFGVSLAVDDGVNDIFLPLESPESLQEAWDSTPKHVRADLQAYAGLTKREILTRFYDYVFYYASP